MISTFFHVRKEFPMREWLAYASGIAVALAYIPLICGILNGSIRQSIATWSLWTTLDLISLVTTIADGGSPWLVLAFTVGAIIVTTLLIRQGGWTWGSMDTFALSGVVASLVIWVVLGPKEGLIASVAAIACAGSPALLKAFRFPAEERPVVWMLFGSGGVFALLAAPTSAIADTLFPACSVLMNGLMTIFSLRKPTAHPAP